ncbi:hypothetical protein [Streptomyces sp. NPDC088707]|uniref:hypothetical protein n=1 Tax=Streptomyces sp. NPDC088707 TaxID=3365871 RepID=UPI00380452C8
MDDDTLSHHEYDTEPFTAGELAAILNYRKAIEGFEDTFSETEAQDFTTVGVFGTAAVQDHLSDLANCLNSWFEALDAALAEMLTCTAEVTRYSTAASRFLKAETQTYHESRQRFEHAVTVFLLGRDTAPLLGNYPRFTTTLNLGQQCLDGPA